MSEYINLKFNVTMNETTNLDRKHILNKLKSLLEIKYIYETRIEKEDSIKPILIIILKGKCSSLTQELSAMVAKIFQEETDFLYRIFSFEYAHQQLKEENLFFVHGCTWNKLVFHNPDDELDSFHEHHIPEKTLNNMQSTFEKECHKMTVFLEGATFFIENKNLSHAAYMLHQHIELWFRFVALFIMGKERKSHSIKELQTYVKAFASELGKLFNTQIEEEQNLLKLLDDAYITTRYKNNYHINLEQIHKILEKAHKMEALATSLFKNKLNTCIVEVSNTKDIK
ncbi:HEPN domain-containing protein, partial [Thalassobellus citreus]|uniref:HEPN domain-containing protein n=1 Tax=Thalassobellus citreus TaxID=3367752 RepID=UPI0037B69969